MASAFTVLFVFRVQGFRAIGFMAYRALSFEIRRHGDGLLLHTLEVKTWVQETVTVEGGNLQ